VSPSHSRHCCQFGATRHRENSRRHRAGAPCNNTHQVCRSMSAFHIQTSCNKTWVCSIHRQREVLVINRRVTAGYSSGSGCVRARSGAQAARLSGSCVTVEARWLWGLALLENSLWASLPLCQPENHSDRAHWHSHFRRASVPLPYRPSLPQATPPIPQFLRGPSHKNATLSGAP